MSPPPLHLPCNRPIPRCACSAAQGNLTALYDTIPKAAVLVEVGPDGSPDLGTARRVLAADVAVGDCMLVKPGEQVRKLFR